MKSLKFLAFALFALSPLVACNKNDTSNVATDTITVAKAVEICKGLSISTTGDVHTSETVYKIAGIVSPEFDPVKSGDLYNFDIVDQVGGVSLICFRLASTFGMPKVNESIVVSGKLERFVDSKNVEKLEVVEGSVISMGSSNNQGGNGGNGGGNGGSQSGTTTITFADADLTDQSAVSSFTSNGYSFTFAMGSNANKNEPSYFVNGGNAIRLYKGNTMTISGSQISSIEFTTTSASYAGPFTASTGSVNGTTWTGNGTSVTFTVTGNQLRISALTITGAGGQGGNGGNNGGGNGGGSTTYTALSVITDIYNNFDAQMYEIEDYSDDGYAEYVTYYDTVYTSEAQFVAAYQKSISFLPSYLIEDEEYPAGPEVGTNILTNEEYNCYCGYYLTPDTEICVDISIQMDNDINALFIIYDVYDAALLELYM